MKNINKQYKTERLRPKRVIFHLKVHTNSFRLRVIDTNMMPQIGHDMVVVSRNLKKRTGHDLAWTCAYIYIYKLTCNFIFY